MLAVVLALVTTLPALSMIFNGFEFHKVWQGRFGIWVVRGDAVFFYPVTARLVIGHPE